MTKEQRLKMLNDTHYRLSTTLFHGGSSGVIAATLEVLKLEIEALEAEVRDFEG